MITFLFSAALAAAAPQPIWGDFSKMRQLPDGRWDKVLLAPDGEKRLRKFVLAQRLHRELEAQLVRAYFVTVPGPGGCTLWNRQAMRGPLIGGVAATVKICPHAVTQIDFVALPPF